MRGFYTPHYFFCFAKKLLSELYFYNNLDHRLLFTLIGCTGSMNFLRRNDYKVSGLEINGSVESRGLIEIAIILRLGLLKLSVLSQSYTEGCLLYTSPSPRDA